MLISRNTACVCAAASSGALAVASGAAAINYTIQALAANGGHIVAQKTIYGGSYNLLEHTLPQYGITTTFVNAHDLSEVENAIVDDLSGDSVSETRQTLREHQEGH